MKKIFLLPLFFAFSFLQLNSESDYLIEPLKLFQSQANSKVELFNLTVTCLSSPSQPPGGSLMYSVRLMNLSGPVANADVKINDPFGRVCTSVKTNPDGEVTWLKQIPADTKPQLYVIEFFYENAKQYSKVAISSGLNTIKLPSYSLNLNISKTLDSRSLVFGNRGGFSPQMQSIEETLEEVVKFGDAVSKDFLSSSVNEKILVLTGLSCSLGEPLSCTAGLKYTESALLSSMVKVLGYKIIDKIEKDEEKRKLFRIMFDEIHTSFSLAMVNPAEGLISSFDLLSIGEDISDIGKELDIYVDNKLKGVTFAIQKKGSNEVYMFCIYDRSISNQQNGTPSKDPNCKEKNTGDYCFQNNTKLDLEVNIVSSPRIVSGRQSDLTYSLRPGQKQCFSDIPAGAAKYDIRTTGTVSAFGSAIQNHNANGSLYVDVCKENTFFISIDKPSYSTNIPAQTDEKNIQPSKNPSCKEFFTGDYCFQNNTKLDLSVEMTSSTGRSSGRSESFICTLQPGQRQCFFNIPAGTAKYDIRTIGNFSAYGSAIQNHYANGSLYVDACRENTFLISVDKPSYATNIPPQTDEKNIPPSKNQSCEEFVTGDYCFQNNTKLDLSVELTSSSSRVSGRSESVTCTLQPGQRQCFFNIPAGAAKYNISTIGAVNAYGSTIQYHNADGSLYVDACKENTFLINIDKPSYSTNIHAQINVLSAQASKDLNCNEKNTGDYCFQNNTKFDLRVELTSSPGKISGRSESFTCSLQPGQRQCFFNVPEGVANYDISTPNASHYTTGSVNVEVCKENTFIIK